MSLGGWDWATPQLPLSLLPPPSLYPGLQAGRSQLCPIFISHIVATGKWIPSPGQASQLPLPPRLLPPHSTLSGLRNQADWGFPRMGVCSVGVASSCPTHVSPLEVAPCLGPQGLRLASHLPIWVTCHGTESHRP